MCGIAGLILTSPNGIGRQLVEMLDGCQQRGPDSSGFAVYHEKSEGQLICRIYLGNPGGAPQALADEEKVLEIIGEHGGEVLRKTVVHEHLRLELNFRGEVKSLCYAIENGAGVEILSMGRRLEIMKGVGTAMDVDAQYDLRGYRGTHGIGHVRLATESVVDVSRAHPFWAYGFNDVAIVHNGQITNYYKMKRRLIKRGYQFRTDNDSELIAVYLADQAERGT